MQPTESRIRIAIIGGGLAGSTLANGLCKHSHIDFKVFEAASAFTEQGAHVTLGVTAQQSLALISPNLRNCLVNAGGVKATAESIFIGEGPYSGEHCCTIGEGKYRQVAVSRALLLEELLRYVPKENLLANKKLERISQSTADEATTYTLYFKDGTEYVFDAVIGADGIHGKVRSFVLGPDSAEVEPEFSRYWVCRNILPYEKVREYLKDRCPNPEHPVKYQWSGKNSFMLYNLMDDCKRVSLVGSGIADESVDPTQWRTPFTREFLAQVYSGWGDFGRAYVDCMMDQSDPRMFYIWHSRKASTYSNGGVAVMGDAAHAPTPWLGSGAVMALEDAVILDSLLGQTHERSGLPAALRAYDRARRPRTQKIVSMSYRTGLMVCGVDHEVKLEPMSMKENLPQRWQWIWDTNVEDLVKEADKIYQEEIA